jgi:hypothetical protein
MTEQEKGMGPMADINHPKKTPPPHEIAEAGS